MIFAPEVGKIVIYGQVPLHKKSTDIFLDISAFCINKILFIA